MFSPLFQESLKKDSINGYMYGNLPGLEVCAGERVTWYIFSLSAEPHPVNIHGHTFQSQHHRYIFYWYESTYSLVILLTLCPIFFNEIIY